MKKWTRIIPMFLGLSLLSAVSAWSQTIRAIPEQPWNGGGTRFYQDGQYLVHFQDTFWGITEHM